MKVEFEISEDQAEAFLLFYKRVGLSDFRELADNEEQAYNAMFACDTFSEALKLKKKPRG